MSTRDILSSNIFIVIFCDGSAHDTLSVKSAGCFVFIPSHRQTAADANDQGLLASVTNGRPSVGRFVSERWHHVSPNSLFVVCFWERPIDDPQTMLESPITI